MTRFEQLAILMGRAAPLVPGGFPIRGDDVEIPGSLPRHLRAQLESYRDLLPDYLNIHADDDDAIAFFDQLGVTLIHVTEARAVAAATAALDADAARNGRPVAADIETASRTPTAPRVARLTKDGALHGVQLKPEATTAPLSPYTGRIAVVQCYAGSDSVFVFTGDALPTLLAGEWIRTTNFVAHSAGFELTHLRWAAKELRAPPLGLLPGRWNCTQQGAGLVIGVGYNGSLRSLEAVSEKLLGLKPPKALQTSDWGLAKHTRGQLCYAATDAVLTWRIWQILTAELTRLDRRDAYRLQLRCIDPVSRMELRGVGIDREEFARQLIGWGEELSRARTLYNETTSEPAPDGSPKDTITWLKRTLTPEQLAEWPMTKGGQQLSTSTPHLKRLHAVPGAHAVLRILAMSKLCQSFGAKFIAKLNPVTGRFHSQLKIAAAETGRFSSSQPNLQQLPSHKAPQFRECIVARERYVLVAADYSQIEVRIACIYSGCAVLDQMIREGRDIHRETAAAIAGIDPADVTDEQRKAAKAVVFGALYGMGPATLAAYAFAFFDVTMTEDRAHDALDGFFDRFPELKVWRTDHYYECQAQGFILIPTSGRVIDIEWSNLEPKALPFTLCCNAPIQGGGADLIMLALQWVDRRLREAGIDDDEGLILTVHDELLLEVRTENAERAREILQQTMIEAFEAMFPGAPVNGLVSATIGHNWSECK
jgi:DNA polymerase-1